MQCIWIEIPASDITRAKTFYEGVFEHGPTELVEFDGRTITVIDGQPTVALNETPGFVPTTDGSIPYFHVEAPIADTLRRVAEHGGQVVEQPAPRPGFGLFSLVTDTEGNSIYLQAES